MVLVYVFPRLLVADHNFKQRTSTQPLQGVDHLFLVDVRVHEMLHDLMAVHFFGVSFGSEQLAFDQKSYRSF